MDLEKLHQKIKDVSHGILATSEDIRICQDKESEEDLEILYNLRNRFINQFKSLESEYYLYKELQK